MRVTVEHREQAAGASRDYFVDCTVEFSEEEKAIIKTRGLYRNGFDVPAATPTPSTTSIFGIAAARGGGILLIIAGVVMATIASANHQTGNLAGLILFAGIGLAIYGWLGGRRVDKRLERPEQEITIRRLLADRRFTTHALDPAGAKAAEEEIRRHLVGIKELIRHSAELGAKQTFEL